MSQSCDDGGNVDAWRIVTRRARKRHTCKACGLAILPGHYYTVTGIVWEGTAETIKRCGACELTYRHLRELGRPVDMAPMEALDCGLDYAEEWDAEPPEHIARLPFLTDDERGALLREVTP